MATKTLVAAGNLLNPAIWNGGTLPVAGDSVTVCQGGCNATLTDGQRFPASGSLASFVNESNSNLTMSGACSIHSAAASVVNNNRLHIASGASVTLDMPLANTWNTILSNAVFVFDGPATLTINGNVSRSAAAASSLFGGPAGTVLINGNLSWNSLAVNTPGISLAVTGSVTLTGGYATINSLNLDGPSSITLNGGTIASTCAATVPRAITFTSGTVAAGQWTTPITLGSGMNITGGSWAQVTVDGGSLTGGTVAALSYAAGTCTIPSSRTGDLTLADGDAVANMAIAGNVTVDGGSLGAGCSWTGTASYLSGDLACGTWTEAIGLMGTIGGGTFLDDVTAVEAQGTIIGGTFHGTVDLQDGSISGGMFHGEVRLSGELASINDGVFHGDVSTPYIHGGDFHGGVADLYEIHGGAFAGELTNIQSIYGGTFTASVSAQYIYGGTFAATSSVTGGYYADGATFEGVADLSGADNGGISNCVFHGTLILSQFGQLNYANTVTGISIIGDQTFYGADEQQRAKRPPRGGYLAYLGGG